MNGVWARDADDVHIVGNTETHHFDGARFATQTIERSGQLAAVWGTPNNRVFTIGFNSMNRPGFGELDAGRWRFSAAPPRAFYFSLWTLREDELFAGANLTSIFFRQG